VDLAGREIPAVYADRGKLPVDAYGRRAANLGLGARPYLEWTGRRVDRPSETADASGQNAVKINARGRTVVGKRDVAPTVQWHRYSRVHPSATAIVRKPRDASQEERKMTNRDAPEVRLTRAADAEFVADVRGCACRGVR